MPNTLERKIARIVQNIDDCMVRLLTAVVLETNPDAAKKGVAEAVNVLRASSSEALSAVLTAPSYNANEADRLLYFRWIAEDLRTAREVLQEIDTEKVLVHRKFGEKTDGIFENRLAAVRNKITCETSGIIDCAKDIFKMSDRFNYYHGASLLLVHEIRDKSVIILRQLRFLEKPWLRLMASWKPALAVFILAMLAIAATRIYQGHLVLNPRTQQALSPRIVNPPTSPAAGSGSHLREAISNIKELSDLVGAIPGLLLGFTVLLGLVKGFLSRERWRQRGLDGVQQDLLNASQLLRSQH